MILRLGLALFSTVFAAELRGEVDKDTIRAGDGVRIAYTVEGGGGAFDLPILGDLDGDGDTDLDDWAALSPCATGPAVPYDPQNLPPACSLVPDFEGVIPADINRDGDVDVEDCGLMLSQFTGPATCAGTATSCGDPDCVDCTALAHVSSATCSAASCVINRCSSGFANCDAQVANGCERPLSGHSNAAPGEFLGSYAGDTRTNPLLGCQSQSCSLVQTRTGTRGRWFRVTAQEDSSCCAYVAMTFELDVPAGVDFDLHVSGACACQRWNGSSWVAGCSGINGTGQDEFVVAWCNDDCSGRDDSFTATVEVRYFGGASCNSWQFEVFSRDCYP